MLLKEVAPAREKQNKKCPATVGNWSGVRGSDKKKEGASLDGVFMLNPGVIVIANSP